MLTLATLLGIGFLLGLRHATDADHVIAMSTIVTRECKIRAALLLGALWGVGHTLTLAMVGTLLIGFGVIIPPHIGLALEAAVGFMLVVLGVWALLGVYRAARLMPTVAEHIDEHREQAGCAGEPVYVRAQASAAAHAHAYKHRHAHAHGDYVHAHVHGHGHGRAAHGHTAQRSPTHWLDRQFAAWPRYQWLRPVVIGSVHGLAGSAPIALLIMASMPGAAAALLYFLAFGIGTMLGMATLSGALAAPLVFAARRLPRAGQHMRMLAGVTSISFGAYLIVHLSATAGWFEHTAHGTLRDSTTAHGKLRDSTTAHGKLRDSTTAHGTLRDSITAHGTLRDGQINKELTR